jgi:hypothetical protein
MENNSFSPGPWKTEIGNPCIVTDSRGLTIALAFADGITEDQALDNARLISQAPALLAACQKSEMALREAMPDIAKIHDQEPHADRCFLCELRETIRRAGGAA